MKRFNSRALGCEARASGAPWVSKSTHPRKFGHHVTVHRTNERPSRPLDRHTNVQRHTFWQVWEHRKTDILHRTCYTIVCIVPWCPSVYKTSIASIQSIGFTVTWFFGVLLEALGIFLGLDFWLYSIIRVTWNPEYPPPPALLWFYYLQILVACFQ